MCFVCPECPEDDPRVIGILFHPQTLSFMIKFHQSEVFVLKRKKEIEHSIASTALALVSLLLGLLHPKENGGLLGG